MTRSPADLLVVGGGPAAHAAVQAFRDHGGGSVTVVSADDRPPYDRPPLSKDFLRGETDEGDLPLDDVPLAGAEVVLGTEVVDLRGAQARLSDGTTVAYGTCLLATGSRPRRPGVPGADDPSLLVLRSASDAVRLRAAAQGARTAVVVGSGFIGCEAAVSLARRGLEVTLVTPDEVPQEQRLGPEVGARLRGWLEEDGVGVLAGREVTGFAGAGAHRVGLDDDRELVADLVLLATGVEPLGGLAVEAGAQGHEGRVVVDARMRTRTRDLLAAGDVAFAHNAAAGRALGVEHWGEALAMGEVAGLTAAGVDAAWDAVPGFWSQIGDRTLKQAAWGDGWDVVHVVDHDGRGFTAWYGRDGVVVGVLTHEADADYERGEQLVRSAAAFPPA